jgi:hypothetical protein
MAKIVEVPFDGGTIQFAVGKAGGPQAFGADDIIEKAVDRLEDALSIVRRMGQSFAQQLTELKCQSAEASFGITLTGKGKFIVAEASAEASLSVKLIFKGSG